VDERPRAGAGGATVAFVHPSSTGGVLVELVAREDERDAHR
jgi:methylmalonyl-CoA/ethylmalonyl-CoA epimerase